MVVLKRLEIVLLLLSGFSLFFNIELKNMNPSGSFRVSNLIFYGAQRHFTVLKNNLQHAEGCGEQFIFWRTFFTAFFCPNFDLNVIFLENWFSNVAWFCVFWTRTGRKHTPGLVSKRLRDFHFSRILTISTWPDPIYLQ